MLPSIFDSDRKKQETTLLEKIEAKVEADIQRQREQKIKKLREGIIHESMGKQEISPYDPKDALKPHKDFTAWWSQRTVLANVENRMLVNMELESGDHTQFYVTVAGESFVWKKKRYVIDHMYKYYMISAKTYALDYHENFSLPIKRTVPIKDLRKAVGTNKSMNILHATNPENLERFMNSDLIKKIIQGGSIEELISGLKTWLIVIAVGVAIVLFITLKISGYIK